MTASVFSRNSASFALDEAMIWLMFWFIGSVSTRWESPWRISGSHPQSPLGYDPVFRDVKAVPEPVRHRQGLALVGGQPDEADGAVFLQDGIIQYRGNAVRFQNAFGVWVPMVYGCYYNTETESVVGVSVEAR